MGTICLIQTTRSPEPSVPSLICASPQCLPQFKLSERRRRAQSPECDGARQGFPALDDLAVGNMSGGAACEFAVIGSA